MNRPAADVRSLLAYRTAAEKCTMEYDTLECDTLECDTLECDTIDKVDPRTISIHESSRAGHETY